MVTALLLLAAATPSAEALSLGRELAESGTMATVLPMLQEKETDELIAEHPELSANERIALMVESQRVFEAGRETVIQAEARAYATRMSVADLRASVAFQQSVAGKRLRTALPDVIEDVMPTIAKMNFKRDVSTAFCKATGKLCRK